MMLAVNWGSVAIWAVSLFLVIAIVILAIGAIFAILRGGCSQDTKPDLGSQEEGGS